MTEREKALDFNAGTKTALQIVFKELNYGQRKKLYENPEVRLLMDRYGILV